MRGFLFLLAFGLLPCGCSEEPAAGPVQSGQIAAGPGFTVEIPQSLRPTPESGRRGILIFDSGGNSPAAPNFVASRSTTAIPGDEQRVFAAQRVVSMPQADISRPTSHAPVVIDGLPGWETVAKGRHPETGAPLRVYQVILFEDDGYFLMQGRVGEELAGKYEPEFRKTAHSLVRTRR